MAFNLFMVFLFFLIAACFALIVIMERENIRERARLYKHIGNLQGHIRKLEDDRLVWEIRIDDLSARLPVRIFEELRHG